MARAEIAKAAEDGQGNGPPGHGRSDSSLRSRRLCASISFRSTRGQMPAVGGSNQSADRTETTAALTQATRGVMNITVAERSRASVSVGRLHVRHEDTATKECVR